MGGRKLCHTFKIYPSLYDVKEIKLLFITDKDKLGNKLKASQVKASVHICMYILLVRIKILNCRLKKHQMSQKI